jgi:hypothetical protein
MKGNFYQYHSEYVCLFVLEQCNMVRWFPHKIHVHPQECGGKLMMIHTCGFDHG